MWEKNSLCPSGHYTTELKVAVKFCAKTVDKEGIIS